jgi:hypothetical protein
LFGSLDFQFSGYNTSNLIHFGQPLTTSNGRLLRETAVIRHSAPDGLLPTWRAEDLREVIPDEQIRIRFVIDLSPLPLDVYLVEPGAVAEALLVLIEKMGL